LSSEEAPAQAPQAAEPAAPGTPQSPPPPPPSTIVEASEENIAAAAERLRAGELVAFPTETVYGLGADAANADAVARIFKLKGRPAAHPVILHLRDASELARYARDIPATANLLAEKFWPGPLTLILKRSEAVSDAVTGGQDTVGLRVPAHPVAQALLAAFGGALAAPSANRFGRVSPTRAAHVTQDFVPNAPLILDGDASPIGIESTIVDLSGDHPRVLRPGAISQTAIEETLGAPLAWPDESAPRASGSLAKHYAPRAALRILKRTEMIDLLVGNRGRRVAVLALEVKMPRLAPALVRVLSASAPQYAQGFYAALRELDATGADLILVERPPQTPAWSAVNDRLMRAAHSHDKK
jgi:L-threonylcarbamoyladenylate synthase